MIACSSKETSQYLLSGATMGTTYNVKIVFEEPQSDSKLSVLQKGIDAALNQVDHLMSTYKQDSEVSQINRLVPGHELKLSPETIEVLLFAQKVSQQSSGYFDITVASLVNIWGFGPKNTGDEKPSQTEIDEAKSMVGWQSLTISKESATISKSKGNLVDLSAIAKGYGVDRVAGYLKTQNLHNFLVEVGGEVQASGHNKELKDWRLGIEQPDLSGRRVYTTVALKNLGMATSGDYRNYFEKDGQRYSHTIDPNTGYPVNHKLASVSVVAETCMEADALATALNVMGEDQGYQFALKENIGAYFIYREGGEFKSKYTPVFEQYLAK